MFTSLFSKFATVVLEKLFFIWIKKIGEKYEEYLQKKKQDEIDQKNLDKYKQSIKEGKDEEISKNAQDFLNGINR